LTDPANVFLRSLFVFAALFIEVAESADGFFLNFYWELVGDIAVVRVE